MTPTDPTPRTIAVCLGCSLPECLEDHPRCAYHHNRKRRVLDPTSGTCSRCLNATPVTSENWRAPHYYRCAAKECFVGGFLDTCSDSIPRPVETVTVKPYRPRKRRRS